MAGGLPLFRLQRRFLPRLVFMGRALLKQAVTAVYMKREGLRQEAEACYEIFENAGHGK